MAYFQSMDCYNQSKQLKVNGELDAAYIQMLQSFEYDEEYKLDERADHFIDILSEMKNYKECEEFTCKLLQKQPYNFQWLFWNGVALSNQSKFEKAEIKLVKCLNINPNHMHTLLNIAFVMTEQGKYNEAISYYRRAMQKDPSNISAIFGLGNALFHSQQYTECEVVQMTLIAMEPNNDVHQSNYSDTLVKMKKYNQAKAQYIKYLNMSPNNPNIHSLKNFLDLLVYLKDWDILNEYINKYVNSQFIETKEKGILLNGIGIKYADNKMNYESLAMYQRAVELMTSNKENPNEYAIFLSNYIGAFHKIFGNEETLKEMISMINKYPLAINAQFYNKQGLIYSNMNDHEKSGICYQKAIKLSPHTATYYTNYIVSLFEMKQFKQIKELCINQYLSKFPQNDKLNFYVAYCYSEQNQWNQADKYYQKAINSDPTNVTYISNQCYVLCEMKQFENAKNKIRPWLLNDFKNQECLYRMGWIFKEQGGMNNYIESERWFKKCMELDVDNKHNRVYMAYGHLLYLMNKSIESDLKYFEKSISICWDNYVTHYYYALSLMSFGKYELSEKEFKISLGIKENYAECHCDFGLMLFQKLKRKQEGMQHILKANQIAPRNKLIKQTINRLFENHEDNKENINDIDNNYNNNNNNEHNKSQNGNKNNDDNKDDGPLSFANFAMPNMDQFGHEIKDDIKENKQDDNGPLSFANFVGMMNNNDAAPDIHVDGMVMDTKGAM